MQDGPSGESATSRVLDTPLLFIAEMRGQQNEAPPPPPQVLLALFFDDSSIT
jgi:hypothetical protein